MLRRFAVLVVALFAFLPAFARAQDHGGERITNYMSDVTVSENGTLTVVETITVNSLGEQIRHGIFRDFPTTYTKDGNTFRVGFSVISVTMDGQPEHYTVSGIDAGKRIKIGDADTLLQNGLHVFVITYTTTRQIGFFDKFDEIYWNVTGNFWPFPIDHAYALIHLPAGANIIRYASYTGAAGSTANNGQADKLSENQIRFNTDVGLGPQEGMTVAVDFAKGAVRQPTSAELRADYLRDHADVVVAVLGLLILAIYFSVTWYEFGRDPDGGPVIPLFAPPNGFSPAAVRYVHRMAYDRKAFSATIINLAVNGYLTISQSGNIYTLTKKNGTAPLTDSDQAVRDRLFAEGDTLELKQTHHTLITAAISALRLALKREYEKAYFLTNLHWFIGGVAILIITGLAATLLSANAGGASGILFWLGGWSIGCAVLLHRCYDAWNTALRGPGSRFLNVFSALGITLFAVPFTVALVVVFVVFGGVMGAASIPLIVGGVLAYVFYHLLKAPTALGAKTMAEINGFREFLNTAERNRLEILNPPQVTPAVFEKYLPYAIALDCENQWSKRFEAEAEAAGVDPSQSGYYAPVWYSGSGNFQSAAFASSLGASMAAAAASAATAPGSSSGGGGGGFSGGGGGGGGGGGW
ncbi:MAG TPA: DUF2207 domain-containing protein [Rhizomicrobium sp.]|jgi:hypothetical protein